jgi:hypothetical protein
MYKFKNITLASCLLVLASCLLSLTSCKRNPTTWDDNIVAPLANGSLTLGNLFPDTVIKANHDSSLYIVVNANLINYQLDSLLKIPDTAIVTVSTNTYVPDTISPGEILPFTAPSITKLDLPNGIQLRMAIVKQGKVKVALYNSVTEPLVYVYQIPSATKGGVVFSQTFNIPAAPNRTKLSKLITYIDLSGYTIDLTGQTHNSVNTVVQNGVISIAAAPIAHKDSLFIGQGLIDTFTLQGIIPQYALGYFGNQSINVGPDTAAFNVFNSIKKGILNLNSANVILTINNQFGVEMDANISNITSINTNNPSNVVLTYTNVQLSNVQVAAAHDNNGPNNPVVNISASTKTITLNNSNSNIDTFIGNLPGRLSYKLNAQVNPMGNVSGNNDFGYYGTSFSANLNMNVPLFFSASNLMLADTVSLNLSTVSQFQNINSGNLILTATNSYPFSINLVATLLDGNKQPIGSLFSSPSLIQCPPLDANSKVVSPLQSKLFIPLTPQKTSILQKAKYVYYTATFNTANQPNQIKFYSNYTLGLLLTADINYTIGK